MTIRLTAAAAKHILDKLTRNPQAQGFRLGIKKGGCSDFMYQPSYASEIKDDDVVFTSENIRIVVAKVDLPYCDGTVIDLKSQGLNQMLIYQNPLAQDACGCGESFTLKSRGENDD